MSFFSGWAALFVAMIVGLGHQHVTIQSLERTLLEDNRRMHEGIEALRHDLTLFANRYENRAGDYEEHQTKSSNYSGSARKLMQVPSAGGTSVGASQVVTPYLCAAAIETWALSINGTNLADYLSSEFSTLTRMLELLVGSISKAPTMVPVPIPTMVPVPSPTAPHPGTITNPGFSCKGLLETDSSLTSGPYYVTGGGGFAAKQVWCDFDDDGQGWTLVFVNINGVSSPTSTGEVNAGILMTTEFPGSPGKLSDAQISSLAAVGDGLSEYRYQCGSTYKRFFQLSHAYANTASLVTSSDKCGTSPSSLQWASGSPSSTCIGLCTTPDGDGCGNCDDRCVSGSENGFWNSWISHWETTSANGCYSRSTGYNNGYMWVR